MARLNQWQRLGAVLSALWIVGGGYWSRTVDLETARSWKETSYRRCVERALAGVPPDRKGCALEAEQVADLFLANSWQNITLFIFGTLIAAWVSGYVLLRVARWIAAGRAAT